MKVCFWGTRGSIATPGPGTNHFGGNTSCVELTTADGNLLIIDCGTGMHPLASKLMGQGKKAINANILIGHTHWDHIQGFPFFSPAFVKGNTVAIYGPEGSHGSLHHVLAGQMEFTYFPIELNQLPAAITASKSTAWRWCIWWITNRSRMSCGALVRSLAASSPSCTTATAAMPNSWPTPIS